MNRKTRIIISITGIIIIGLALLGFTYGYYLTKITGNTNSKSIDVTTGTPSVNFVDLSTEDTNVVITPGTTITKLFTVQNTGDTEAKYSIFLVDVTNNFIRTEDVRYTLYRKNGNNTIDTTDYSDCKIVVSDVEFPTTTSLVVADETITTPDSYYTYALVITYLNQNFSQDEDQGHIFSAKVNVRAQSTDTNPFGEGTLAYNIYNNGAQVLNTTTNELEIDKTYEEKLTITKVSDGTDMTDTGIFTAPDDYGTSYYYRGPVKNNYVNFAGFMWRIVRINGDGSIRLILDGTLDKVKREGLDVYAGSTSAFNENYDDNAHVGYMYGLVGASEYNCVIETGGLKSIDSTITTESACTNGEWLSGYDTTHMNLNDSDVKKEVDKFYETYIENNTNNYHYEAYLADTLFCNDKTTSYAGYGTEGTVYGVNSRFPLGGTFNPTLECAKGATNTYSRFTSNLETITKTNKDVNINNDLKHPIALLSADELVMAGAAWSENESYYLYDAYKNGISNVWWWTASPSSFVDVADDAFVFGGFATFNSLSDDLANNSIGVRPVINLRADVLVDGGDGTSGEGAYTVKLAN